MAIGLTLMGLAVGLLGILCTYIWNDSRKRDRERREFLEQIKKIHGEVGMAEALGN